MTSTVLVITREFDVTADHVILRLAERDVQILRFDLADFPAHVGVSARSGPAGWQGVLSAYDRRVELADIGAVWYRKPTGFRFADTLSEVERSWSAGEAKAGFGGLVTALRCRWINHPARNAAATKPDQLITAAVRCGLRVPNTMITTNPDAARQFCREHHSVVYKSFRGAPYSENGRIVALYTTPVTADSITDAVRLAPHMFQVEIPKQYELRVTCVDGQIFAVRIDAHTDTGRRDWRADPDRLTWSTIDIPNVVATGIRRLMDAYGLAFGALDLIVDPDDRHWLVEINANGQWAWNHPHRDHIADALADALTTPDAATAERIPT